MKKTILILFLALASIGMNAQTALPKVYNESIDPIKQIEQTVSKASGSKKNIIVQLGGNWCIWCLRFASSALIRPAYNLAPRSKTTLETFAVLAFLAISAPILAAFSVLLPVILAPTVVA